MAQKTHKGQALARELGLSAFGKDAETCSLIMRHAASLQRLAVEACNGPGDYVNAIPYPEAGKIYDDWQERVDRETERHTARIKELVKSLPGIKAVDCGGDPRGIVVKLHREDGRYNTMGGQETGWAVPLY